MPSLFVIVLGVFHTLVATLATFVWMNDRADTIMVVALLCNMYVFFRNTYLDAVRGR